MYRLQCKFKIFFINLTIFNVFPLKFVVHVLKSYCIMLQLYMVTIKTVLTCIHFLFAGGLTSFGMICKRFEALWTMIFSFCSIVFETHLQMSQSFSFLMKYLEFLCVHLVHGLKLIEFHVP